MKLISFPANWANLPVFCLYRDHRNKKQGEPVFFFAQFPPGGIVAMITMLRALKFIFLLRLVPKSKYNEQWCFLAKILNFA